MAKGAPFEPKNGLVKWVEARLPIMGLMYEHLVSYPEPKNLNYWWNFGSLAGICLVIQLVTGIVLAMHYTPHETMAFASIEHIMRDVEWGWLLRYTHANGSSLFFLIVYIHIFRGLYYGSYKAPRELIWFIGLILYLCMMATGFLGYVLVWGQMSYWAATVITNFFSAIPFVGEELLMWLRGSFSVGNPALNRFFSLHFLLPFVITAIVIIHLWALHTVGSSNPKGIDTKGPQDMLPFHPYYTMKDLVGLSVFFLILAYFIFYAPNWMSHPDNYIEANPMMTPEHIVPEWYYLPFYAILKAVPDKLGGFLLMLGSIFILFLVPWLDTSKVRSATFRPIYKQVFWLLVLDVILLGFVGREAPDVTSFHVGDMAVSWGLLGQLGTTYYFAHFLVLMPLIGWKEKPKPLPTSISEPVTANAAAE